MVDGRVNKHKTDVSGSDIEEIQVVEFLLGGDTYAVNLFDVREIVEASKITPLPHAPTHIRGIIDLRGEITTIIDLRILIGAAKKAGSNLEDLRFIVLDESVTHRKTGVVVDEVASVLTVPLNDIDQSKKESDDTSYILGVIKKEVGERGESKKELVIWIDICGLIKDKGIK
ncbi:MAG: chemotaxis protein CheW [Methanospirillum sp.]|uniref:chemotaxis protein CheW n=1 Tax=Methanospirillum sp. TaxID=45200 RepID=UPI00236C01B8|nr:chemotaxis protein CheW [Methanospirillum sp.]MDD1729870.1 chemotaxis protein CheW [Methanospirillum sp.]